MIRNTRLHRVWQVLCKVLLVVFSMPWLFKSSQAQPSPKPIQELFDKARSMTELDSQLYYIDRAHELSVDIGFERGVPMALYYKQTFFHRNEQDINSLDYGLKAIRSYKALKVRDYYNEFGLRNAISATLEINDLNLEAAIFQDSALQLLNNYRNINYWNDSEFYLDSLEHRSNQFKSKNLRRADSIAQSRLVAQSLLKSAQESGQVFFVCRAYNQLGLAETKAGNYGVARLYFDSIFNMKTPDNLCLGMALNNMAASYVTEENYQMAQEWLDTAISFKMRVNEMDTSSTIFHSFLTLGEVSYLQGRPNEAIDVWLRALDLVKRKPKNRGDYIKIYNWLAKAYSDVKEEELSELYSDLYEKYKHDYEQNRTALLALLERDIILDYIENSEAREKVRRSNIYNALVFFIFLFSSIILLWQRRRIKRNKNNLYQSLQRILLGEKEG